MSYIQLEFTTSAEHTESLSEQLELWGALSVTWVDAHDDPIYEPAPHTHPLWDQVIVCALFPEKTDIENIKQSLSPSLRAQPSSLRAERRSNPGSEVGLTLEPGLPRYARNDGIDEYIKITYINDENWIEKNLQEFKPIKITDDFWICPSWHQINIENATILHLNPGLAFGTGEHPTTQMILKYLSLHPPKNKMVIDYGCGSGILAISACLLGATKVYATDIDPQALIASENNAQLNHLQQNQLSLSLPENLGALQADLLLANIFLTPLLTLQEKFISLLKPTGEIILSGVLSTQFTQISSAYQEHFDLTVLMEQQDWLLLQGRIKKN